MRFPSSTVGRAATAVGVGLLLAASPLVAGVFQEEGEELPEPSLGLEAGTEVHEAGGWRLELVRASQTAAGLRPAEAPDFDFTPSDWLERRRGNGYFHLGDLNLRLRFGDEAWTEYSTAAERAPVAPLAAAGPVVAAADLAPTLPADIPVRVHRYWEVVDGELALRFELTNAADRTVEIGSLGIPMVFNNILHRRTLEEAHASASFHDPYVGRDAGYLQVVRLTGGGPALLVVPHGDTPFEAWNPLLGDPTRRGVTFEGFHEWMPHSLAHAQADWSDAEPWNLPTSALLEPGESRSWGVRFLQAEGLRDIEPTLREHGRPVAVGVPGYVLPMGSPGRLFLAHEAAVTDIRVEPAGSIEVLAAPPSRDGRLSWELRGREWGRARLTVRYADGLEQTVHYKVIESPAEVVERLGEFLTTEAWYENPDDLFGRSPSVMSYDLEERAPVLEDNRAWIAGLGDEGGGGAWLAAFTKQLIDPDPGEIALLERMMDEVIWGGLQYAEGERAYGVRKSLFLYEPEEFPQGTYSEEVGYGGWSSWDREEAESVVRSYNYPHVAAAHWVMYRLARNYEGLVSGNWDRYLERAWRTGVAMVEHAPHYAQFGQMAGTVFLRILEDLEREGWGDAAAELEGAMRGRAEVWRSLPYPFGSEMPWDSTGQEEVYGWSRRFGFDERAEVTLNAILAYMPTVPHWGYNGSARRYWDFQYAGKLRRVERQLHHYGSGLNAIPVLDAYRRDPADLYLLRVGFGGLMGAIANITEEGFPPAAFHAWPDTLRIDAYTGDYGMGFFGHAVNTGAYVVDDPDLGWLGFGATLTATGDRVSGVPWEAGRARLFLAPLGLWLSLESGKIERFEFDATGVRLWLSASTEHVRTARLRVEGGSGGVWRVRVPTGRARSRRGAYEVPLPAAPQRVEITLRRQPSSALGGRPIRSSRSGEGPR